ncbi:ATP-binding cassette domain-containing protein [Streptomyces sp. NBC_01451]|uniref:ATP-binding cassette domain-containing protein n=1 Tax=Streptomyces sp. NBC_01451 TaxID=2903872 RepID=UPI002E2F8DD4|nr:ATP-binding cassette domain-containing protein [Streptomyces sp. NBC_01451]
MESRLKRVPRSDTETSETARNSLPFRRGTSQKGGHQISGGQWQRLGVARARHRDARILVVDEPTSALDAETEQRVFDQIRSRAAAGQTIILITHRLHSVRHADEIYVLDRGRVAEHGTFEDLLRPDDDGPGLFRRMYLVQSEQYRLDGEQTAE